MRWKRLHPREGLPVVAVALLVLTGCSHDRVLFNNPNATGQIGILLDGNVDGSNTNDRAYTTAANGHVDPGVVISGAANEVVTYQQQRAVHVLENAPWTNGNDTVAVDQVGDLGAGFRVWLVQGPEADRRSQAIQACVRLSQIWRDERAGTRIAAFTITDSTGDPDRAAFLDFTCGEAAQLRNLIGHQNGRINIYYVNRVDFGNGFATSNGVWCGSNTLVMGSGASDHLSAHEVGHGFALDHVNGLVANFDTTNVMHNASNNRMFLTEGQSFRSHLNPASAINATYNLRPGQVTRACGALSETATNTCPAIQKRIWADGAFPAN